MSAIGKTIRVWTESLTVDQTKDLAYWERNMLALRYAQGWYKCTLNYAGWSRVLSLDDGAMNFHIPDDFDVGNLPEIAPTWDGHTTEQKWARVERMRGVGKCEQI